MKSYNEKIAYNKGYRIDKDGVVSYEGRIITLQDNGKGYKVFGIRNGGKKLQVKVHRLQAFMKFGDAIYQEGMLVRHLNGKPSDNSWNNLALGTDSDNKMDIPESLRISKAIKASSKARVYTDEELASIREDRKNGMQYKELMAKYSISSKGTLYYILNSSYKTIK